MVATDNTAVECEVTGCDMYILHKRQYRMKK